MIAERKLRNRQLTDDGNVEINGRDLRMPSRAPTTRTYFRRAPANLSARTELEWPQARS
jgi:hypothetical protein